MSTMSRNIHHVAQLCVDGVVAEVTYKPIKNLRLRVLPPDGRVVVSVPLGIPERTVREFVHRHSEWIARSQTEVRAASPAPEPLRDGATVRLWGRPLDVRVTPSAGGSAALERDVVHLAGPDEEGLRRALDTLYRRELAEALPALRREWEPRVGLGAASVKLRRMKTRWGTCNSRTAAITLNIALAERPPSALEYVLVHELVHLHERGHGPAFSAWMDLLLPDWRARRRALRTAG